MSVRLLLFCSVCFYHILLVLLCNFLVIPFVGVGKYCLSTILTLFLASRRFVCLFNPSAPALWDAFISVLRCILICMFRSFVMSVIIQSVVEFLKECENVLPENGVCGANFVSVIMILLLITNTRNVYLTGATSLNNITYKPRKP